MYRSICIALLVLLSTAPAASAELVESPGWSRACQPPAWVRPDAALHIEVCQKVVATCEVTTIYGEGGPSAFATAGFRAAVPVIASAGKTLFVECRGVAHVAALNYGTEAYEPRYVDLQLGKALGGDVEPAPPVVEALDVYTIGRASYLELELGFHITMTVPGYTFAGGDIDVSGPAELHNTPYMPTVSVLDAPGIHLPFTMSGEALTIVA